MKLYHNNLGLPKNVLVDVQVEMSSLRHMLFFSARLGNFGHAEPSGKIFHKTSIYPVLMNRKAFNFLYQLAQLSLRSGHFRALTFLCKANKSFRMLRSE